MNKKYNFAIVGALGKVGTEMTRILEASSLPINSVTLMDLPRFAGERVTFRGEELSVVAAEEKSFRGVDIAFFSAGGEASKELAPLANKAGCLVIDNSAAFRMDPQVPLVVPEVNPRDVEWHRGIIANPNCSTIQMVVVLKPLHDAYTIKRVVVSTYQAVSGTGKAAVDELEQQIRDHVKGETLSWEVYPHQIAFNALPHIDIFQENLYTKEEMKMVHETHKMLDESIKVTATTVRIPVVVGHSESVNIETEKPFALKELRQLLSKAPGVVVEDDPFRNIYPLALKAAGRDEVFVGRIRRDDTIPNGINLWIVADNLRKGAALNAVQIAELIIKEELVRVP
ncbi:aspartate-semialdehyde dehydrogenase [bacterium (candidate division B38) B3_B38]|nr:MAG: aspartate-semialdehyde dehydrogenase [bacterium (candidate division B38) B3_B38]